MPPRSKDFLIFDQEKNNNRTVEWKGTLGHQERSEEVLTVMFKHKDLQDYPVKKGRAK